MEYSSVQWEPDIAVPDCTLCHARFNLVTRRSHCRACGHVICKKCSPTTNFVFAGDVQARICVACEKLYAGKPPPAPVDRGRAGTLFEQSVKQLGGKVMGGGHRLLHLIKPGTPEQTGFPFRNLSDETTCAHWRSFEPFVGTFVFSTTPIDIALTDGAGGGEEGGLCRDKLLTHFRSTQEIYGRAIWPTAIRNYPLGGKKGQEPEYGPDFIAEWTPQCNANVLYLVMFLKIDGTPLVRRTHAKFGGNLCYFQTRGPVPETSDWGRAGSKGHSLFEQDPEIEDFYSFTCSIGCTIKPNLMNFTAQSEWEKAVPSLVVALEELSVGLHRIELELCFLITSNPEEKIPPPNHCPEKALCQDTLMSFPIASGSFTYEVVAPPPPIGAREEQKSFSQTTSSLPPSPTSSSSSSPSSSSSSFQQQLRPKPQSATLPVEGLVSPSLRSGTRGSPEQPRSSQAPSSSSSSPSSGMLSRTKSGGEQQHSLSQQQERTREGETPGERALEF